MKKILALAAVIALPACTDPYGNPDPAGTALLGAAAGAAVGYGVSQATVSQNAAYRPYGEPGYYGRPVYRGRYHRRPPPYYSARYRPPPPAYYRGPPAYYRGW